jgi:sugar phosphate isomerase/epimerase
MTFSSSAVARSFWRSKMWTLSGFADEIDPDLDAQCTVLKQLGIGFLEFRSAWDVNVLDLTDQQVSDARRILGEHGLQVSSIGSPIGKINIEDDFDAHLERMDRAVWVANALGAPFIRVFSFFLTADQKPEDYRDEVVRRMSALAENAQEGGVVLLHENEKEIFGDVPERVHDIVTSVSSPALRLAWDAANYVQCGVVPFPEAYELLRPYTDYIQIKDAVLATAEVVPAGEGDGRIAETMRALAADGFDGFFSMEPHLAAAHHLGGFSGPENFIRATNAFTAILNAEGISYR